MMKKYCCILLCLTILLGAFSAFAEGPVEIEYWFGLGGKLGDLFISLIDEYNASQDKVRVTGVQYADYFTLRQSYQAALASGTEPDARMMAILTCIADPLRNTLDNMATPISVKANGGYLGYLPLPSISKVTICDLKLILRELYSSFEISNIKSSGNRSIFRRTACFKTFVST